MCLYICTYIFVCACVVVCVCVCVRVRVCVKSSPCNKLLWSLAAFSWRDVGWTTHIDVRVCIHAEIYPCMICIFSWYVRVFFVASETSVHGWKVSIHVCMHARNYAFKHVQLSCLCVCMLVCKVVCMRVYTYTNKNIQIRVYDVQTHMCHMYENVWYTCI